MNKKDSIKRHIINSIISGELKINEKIPSERELERIHNCSRQPIRAALASLTHSNWVQPKVGSGYFVVGYGSYKTLFAKDAFGVEKTVIRNITKEEENILNEWKYKHIEKKTIFVKEYILDNDIVIKSINIINNNYLLYLKKKEIEEGFIQSLLKHKVKITHQNRSLKFLNDKLIAKEFNWENEMPIIKSELYEGNDLIELSLMFFQKKYFSFENKVVF